MPAPYYPNADIPPGWEHNPSEWSDRMPVILLAVTGFLKVIALHQQAEQ